jgi:hypothetical protein
MRVQMGTLFNRFVPRIQTRVYSWSQESNLTRRPYGKDLLTTLYRPALKH